VLLLDRRDKQFRLTVAGQRFHVLAQRLLEMQRHIKAEMGEGTVREAVLRVGAIESVVHSWLTGWLQHMRVTYPDFELELTVETTPVLVDQLQRGKQDLVFAALPAAGDGVRTRAVSPMPMCFVGHRELHLRRRYRVPDLLSFDLLTFQRGSQPHVALLEFFRAGGYPAPRVHAISSISAMAQLVEAGFGVATLPRAVVEPLARRLPLRVLPCDATLEPLPIYASYRDDPSSSLLEAALGSALVHASHRPGSSKKSMS
jgi:DNA-binding transcriptional LysR family regulator